MHGVLNLLQELGISTMKADFAKRFTGAPVLNASAKLSK